MPRPVVQSSWNGFLSENSIAAPERSVEVFGLRVNQYQTSPSNSTFTLPLNDALPARSASKSYVACSTSLSFNFHLVTFVATALPSLSLNVSVGGLAKMSCCFCWISGRIDLPSHVYFASSTSVSFALALIGCHGSGTNFFLPTCASSHSGFGGTRSGSSFFATSVLPSTIVVWTNSVESGFGTNLNSPLISSLPLILSWRASAMIFPPLSRAVTLRTDFSVIFSPTRRKSTV